MIFSDQIDLEKKQLGKTAAIACTVFMLLAHMYAFTNGPLLFDAIGVYRGDINLKVSSDKWAGGFYWWMDLGVNCPWLAGVWACVLMSLIVFLICDLLRIRSTWGIVLVSGLCAVHTSIIAEQQYTGQNFFILLPLLEAAAAAWILRRQSRHPFLTVAVSLLLTALSAGTYGALVSVLPALLLTAIVFDILAGRSGKENWVNAVRYAGVFLGGMMLYYGILRFLLWIQGGVIQSYMGEDALSSVRVLPSMLRQIPQAYQSLFYYYAGKSNYLPPLLNTLLPIIMIFGAAESLILLLCKRKQLQDPLKNSILLGVALILSPAVLNLIEIMAMGHVHYLMIYTYCIPIIAFVKVQECLTEEAGCFSTFNDMGRMPSRRLRHSILSTVWINRGIFLLFLYYSIVMANAVYTNYQQMYVETISAGTRVLERIESCEGFDGTEEIVLLGAMQGDPYWGVPSRNPAMILDAFFGSGNVNNINGINYASWMRRFLTNVLDSTLSYTFYNSMEEFTESQFEILPPTDLKEIKDMSYFPRQGSVKKIGGKIYVRFSDNPNS